MEEDESDGRSSFATTTSASDTAAAAASTVSKSSRNRNSTKNNSNPATPIPSPTPPNRKAISYSQPLSNYNPPALGPTPRRSSHRKHSLDDDHSLFYPHYISSPLPSFFPHHPNIPPGHHSHSISGSGGSLTLERAISEYGGAPGTLPEFTGGGGNTGIFRVPVRAAVHPTRPLSLELRPHPLRETQAGSFLRALAANGNQLWAASESGLRMWSLSDMWGPRAGDVRRGDEDTAPFYETCRTSPVICLAVDQASGFVWSGHKDGKIWSWKMDASMAPGSGLEDRSSNGNGCRSHFTEGLSWQAHARDPVLSMVITSYG